MDLFDINPLWEPPDNRPNDMRELGGYTEEFSVWDLITSPRLKAITDVLTSISDEIKSRYSGARSRFQVEPNLSAAGVDLILVVHLPEYEKHTLTVTVPTYVLQHGSRDELAERTLEFVVALNNWLQQEGLQLPGDEIKFGEP